MRTEIFDSTLRDGTQGEGISFSVQDKMSIVKLLDEFGVAYIEAGNPGSNPKDVEFFNVLKTYKPKNSKLVAFGSTARNADAVGEDKNICDILSADTPAVAIFGKSWDLHVEKILKIPLEENLRLVKNTMSYLASKGKEVIFDAEHFFDGYKKNREYALSVLAAAVDGGAQVLCLCDTNGGTMPHEIGEITAKVCEMFPSVRVGIHCHDDTGCAVASSLTAVVNGACHVQGTFIGFGERCGNADLSTVIADLSLKMGYDCGVDLTSLTSTGIKIAEISNVRIRNNHPYIGKSAFAHKGGMHIDGVQKCRESFEHIEPEQVGNERKFLMSEVAGRGTVLPRIQKFAPHLTKQSPEIADITAALKEAEHYGYQYEAADASFELFVKKHLGLLTPHFNVLMYKVEDGYPALDGKEQTYAIVKVEVDGKTELTCACSNNGPVDALDSAFRKAISVFYPCIENVTLEDYKVRVISSGTTTDSRVRVLVESVSEDRRFTTVGVSCNIIEASFKALVDSFEYELSIKEN